MNLSIESNIKLSQYTTFQLGGPCQGLIFCQTPEELCEAVAQCHQDDLPFILIGGGSNLLISDKGLNCYVIRFFSNTPLIEKEKTDLIVSGSTQLDCLAQFAAENGLEGLNYTSGIPGTVGGAVAGNAGAFGKQIGDVLTEATLLTQKGEQKIVHPGDLNFSYRNSILKKTHDILISAQFSLTFSDKQKLFKERADILSLRQEKHPDLQTSPCAGSFFRNIEPTSNAEKRQAAGWFLEQAGAKKLKCGGASVFDKHANIIVKSKSCSAQDVYTLANTMAEVVKKKFNLDLVREVQIIGEFIA